MRLLRGCLMAVGAVVVLAVVVIVVLAVSSGSRGGAPAAGTTGGGAAPAAADPNRGIVFGKPITAGPNTVAVLVTNTGQTVKSFTVKATYKRGDTIAATAAGAVNDIPPGGRQVAILGATEAIPADATPRVDVDTMVLDSASTAKATAAGKITFGKPTVVSGGLARVDVEATNGDGELHSFLVGAAFLKGGELVAAASGALNDVAAGQTKTATLLVAGGNLPAYDEVLVHVGTMVK